MATIKPNMVLKCKQCDERPAEDSVLEAFQLHMMVFHDTDEVAFDLLPLCTCGRYMKFAREVETGNTSRQVDQWVCTCGNDTFVRKGIDV